MELKLYRVPGISKTDTPYFASQSAQEQYFESKRLATIKPNDFYYPPFYEDVIKVEWDTYRLYTNANYLSFTFNGLVCYYFINSVTYLNESVWELHVEMDVIQTFYFMINFHSGICERRHIARWIRNTPNDPYKINRSYIRENVSNNISVPKAKNFISKITTYQGESDSEELWLGIKLNSTVVQSGATTFTRKFTTRVHQLGTVYMDFNGYTFFCINRTINKIKVYHNGSLVHSYTGDIAYPLPFLIDDPKTNEVIIYKGKPFASSHGYIDGTTLVINDEYARDYTQDGIVYGVVTPKYTEVQNPPGIETSLIGDLYMKHHGFVNIVPPYSFSRCTGTNAQAQIKYEPCLLDENYIRLTYGDGTSLAEYPTYNVVIQGDVTKLYINYLFGLEDGSITLLINDTDTFNFNNTYDSLLVLSDVVNLDIMSSPWKDYIANNKNRYITAAIKTGCNAAQTIVSMASSLYGADVSSKAITNNPRMYKPKRGGLTAKASRRLDDIRASTITDLSNTAAGGLSGTMAPIYQLLEDSNMQTVPLKTSSFGNPSALTNFTCNVYYQWHVVQNISYCFKFYTMYGNRVDELWSASTSSTLLSDLFTTYNVRYYYNYLKFRDLNVELSYFDSIEKREQLEERLMAGIRLWNVANRDVIGDYSLDNVERSFLS